MRTLAIVILLTATIGCATQTRTRARSVTPLDEFNQRVASYADLHKQVNSKLPRLKAKAEPTQLVEHQKLLQRALIEARRGAKQGEIFTPAVRPYLQDLIRAELSGRANMSARDAIKESNPKGGEEASPKPVPLAVNAVYPKEAPLTTVPPSLLLKLPKLPEQLEFRFVGKALILRDTAATIIVDYLPDVMP